MRARRARQPELERERQRAWRDANRERVREYQRRWDAANPEALRANKATQKQRRRARLAGVECTLTRCEWVTILVAANFTCTYCGRDDVPMTQDHVVPIARGGAHTAQNVVPACLACNVRKGTKLI